MLSPAVRVCRLLCGCWPGMPVLSAARVFPAVRVLPAVRVAVCDSCDTVSLRPCSRVFFFPFRGPPTPVL